MSTAFLNQSIHSHIDYELKNQKNPSNLFPPQISYINQIITAQGPSRLFIFNGPTSCGKSAASYYLSQIHKPSLIVSSSQISTNISKHLRSCVSVKIVEEKTILCGEVFEIRENRISLRTLDAMSEFEIGPGLQEELNRLNITLGDVIQIDKNNGAFSKLGKTYVRQTETDIVGPDNVFVDTPTGELIRKEEFTSVMTLNQMDILNESLKKAPVEVSGSFFPASKDTQDKIDEKVQEWLNEKSASFIRGLLVVDDAQNLSEDLWRFLNHAVEMKFCPFIILIWNGSKNIYPSNSFLVNFPNVTRENYQKILRIFINSLGINQNSNKILTDAACLAEKYDLKYVMDLITILVSNSYNCNLLDLQKKFKNINDF